MLVVQGGEQSTALQPTAPFAEPLLVSEAAAEPLLVTVALPRDEFNDA